MNKQSTHFTEKEETILQELKLDEAGALANQIRTVVEAHSYRIEVVGSIRRQKP